MIEKAKKAKRPEEKLRLVILNDATFEERFSRRFSYNQLIYWGAGLLVVLLIGMFFFISLTPVKRLIPGYASIENNTYVIRMKQYVDDLETQLDIQEKYNQSLRRLLTGEKDSLGFAEELEQIIQESATPVFQVNDSYAQPKDKPVISDKKKIALGSFFYVAPLKGKINHKVDFRNGHYGIDISGVSHSPIKAIMEGIVVFADYTTKTGYTIAIQHPNDMVSIYKHNEKLLRDVGHFVANGEAIAIIGNTGTLTDGPHLHFELWYKSTPLNPEDYILFD